MYRSKSALLIGRKLLAVPSSSSFGKEYAFYRCLHHHQGQMLIRTNTVITEFRTLRRAGPAPPDGEENATKHRKEKDGDKESKDEKSAGKEEEADEANRPMSEEPIRSSDPEYILHEFQQAFRQFLIQFVKREGNKNNQIFEANVRDFVAKFNEKRLADSEYEVNSPYIGKIAAQTVKVLLLFAAGGALLMGLIMQSSGGISSVSGEHKQIMAEPGISVEQFLHTYLPTGEVSMIYFYPLQNSAVAILHPGAVVGGNPFYGPGLHINMDEQFRRNPMAFVQRMREEENRLGIAPFDQIPIAGRSSSPPFLRFFIIYCLLMLLIGPLVISKFGRKAMQRMLFKVEKKQKK